MGFFANLFNLNPRIEQPPINGGFVVKLGGKSKVLAEDYLSWYKTNPMVFTAINERAKAVANVKFYIRTDEGELIENELTKKLNKPNEYLSRNEFIMQLMTYKGIWGTGYIYLNRLRPSQGIEKTSLMNLPTNQVMFGDDFMSAVSYDFLMEQLKFSEEKDRFSIYYVGIDNVEKKPLIKENLVPFFDTPIFNNPYYSESRLRSQIYTVSNIQAGLESENTFLSTPAGMGMLVPDSKDATGVSVALRDDEKEKIERQLQEDYGSLSDQRNIRVLNKAVKYVPTMVDISKLKLNESIIKNSLILFGAYSLPKELLTALMSGSTFENQKTAYRNFIQTTAQTEADSIANSLDIMFPSREGRLVASFAHMPIMQENEREKAQVKQTTAQAIRLEKDVWDDWLSRGIVTDEQYKENFNL
jgi:hypothetical protein